MPAPVWDWADAGDAVTVTIVGQSKLTKTEADGKWSVMLDKIDGGKVILSFKHTDGGLTAKHGELKGFTLAGADKKWHWATARIESVTVVWDPWLALGVSHGDPIRLVLLLERRSH